MAIGLVLGGGAPNLTLMTGALYELDLAGVEFKVVTTTGAGMVVGLVYAAPRRESGEDWVDARQRALLSTREWGIDDAIYEVFPVNYKIFNKPGTLAEAFARDSIPFLWSIPRDTRRQRLLGDTLAFWAAMISPSSLNAYSKGLCQPPPWIEQLVEFPELKQNLAVGDKKFRLSAYCIETEKLESFNKHEITAEHFRAALAMPFIYEPYRLRDHDGTYRTFIEGSALQTLDFNNENVMVENDIDTIIYFDLMGHRELIGEPRWLIDAWGKSIVAPLTRIAERDIAEFTARRRAHHKDLEIARLKRQAAGENPDAEAAERARHKVDIDRWHPKDDPAHHHPVFGKTKVLRMRFEKEIPPDRWPKVLDWSHSNMAALFDIGRQTARKFLEGRMVNSRGHEGPPIRDRLDYSMRCDPHRAVEKGLDSKHAHDRASQPEPA